MPKNEDKRHGKRAITESGREEVPHHGNEEIMRMRARIDGRTDAIADDDYSDN